MKGLEILNFADVCVKGFLLNGNDKERLAQWRQDREILEKELKAVEIMKQIFNDNTILVKDSKLGYIAEIHPKTFRFNNKEDFDLLKEVLKNE